MGTVVVRNLVSTNFPQYLQSTNLVQHHLAGQESTITSMIIDIWWLSMIISLWCGYHVSNWLPLLAVV